MLYTNSHTESSVATLILCYKTLGEYDECNKECYPCVSKISNLQITEFSISIRCTYIYIYIKCNADAGSHLLFQHIITSSESANKNTSEKTAVQQTSDFWFQYRTQKTKVQKLFREGRKQIIFFFVP